MKENLNTGGKYSTAIDSILRIEQEAKFTITFCLKSCILVNSV